MKRQHSRWQAGDTIVEVLIAIAVVSVVLTGAFALSNHSTAAVLDSQEHAQARQYLQTQVELYRTYLATHSSPAAFGTAYCMNDSTAITVVSGSKCQKTVGGAVYNQTFSQTASGSNLYKFSINWQGVQGMNQESYLYRVYPI